MKTIETCYLKEASEKFSELLIWFSYSRNFVKKHFNKKDLQQKIKAKEVLELPLDFVNFNRINPEYDGPVVKVLFEDENILALEKPYKTHMHPLSYSESDNLLSFLRSQDAYAKLLTVNAQNYDRGLLFRLDYETSGVCFYAKKEEIYQEVRANFASLARKKEYRAIIQGKLAKEEELSHYLKAFGEKKHKMKTSEDGELAQLIVTPLSYHIEEDLTLVKIALKTGLRHQIRCQLAAIGHPILGDELYGGKKAQRLYLHAYEYQLFLAEKNYQIISKNCELFSDLFDFD